MLPVTRKNFCDRLAKMRAGNHEVIARMYFDNRNKYIGFEDIHKATGYAMRTVRNAKAALIKHCGFVMEAAGSPSNRKHKLVGFVDGKGYTRGREEDSVKAEKRRKARAAKEAKEHRLSMIAANKANKAINLINGVFK